MDVLVLSMREKETIAAALSVSDKGVAIKGLLRKPSILSALLASDVDSVGLMLLDVAEEMNCSYKKVIFLLPLSIFQLDCLPTTAAIKPGWTDELTRWAAKNSDSEATDDSHQFRVAMIRNRPGGVFVSTASLRLDIVRLLEAVAAKIKKQIVRIEPECFGLLRLAGDRNLAVVESVNNWTRVAAFAPDKGLFAISIPTPDGEEWEESMQLVDFAASQTFVSSRAILPVICRSPRVAKVFGNGLRKSLPAHKICPEVLSIGKAVAEPWEEYASLLAAAVIVPDNKDSLAVVAAPLNANFVRIEVSQKRSREVNEIHILRGLKAVLALVILTIIGNVGVLTFYFLTDQNKVPQKLQKEYATAEQSLASLDKKTKLIQQANRENTEAVKIVDSIAAWRPPEVKIHHLNVSESGEISLEGHALLPEIGNVYVERLRAGGQLIRSAYLEKISSTSNFQKTFLIKAQK